MKKIWRGIAILFAMSCLAGCHGKDTEVSQTENVVEQKDDVIKLGLSVDSFVIERWIRDRDVFVTTAKELGAEVNVQDAGGDVQEQISQIEYFIEKEMDVITVIACDCDALSDVLKKAQAAGIKIISYDRILNHAQSDLYISFDNRMVGTLMAESLVAAIPDGGDILMIKGSEEDDNVAQVYDGFMEIIEESNLNVVYEAYCAGWISELAIDYVEEALEMYPDVKGIMCGNDDIASQVVKVLAEKQLAGEIAVVGQDGDLAACQRIVEGTQYMTAFKDIDDLAREAAMYAVRMAQGDELSDVTEVFYDGSNEVPAVILNPVAVKKENIDEIIIKGGFHTKEDVYLNVSLAS